MSDEEEIEEEEAPDPKAAVDAKCAQTVECQKKFIEYERCSERIEGKAGAHCTGQYMDYLSCVDHCVRPAPSRAPMLHPAPLLNLAAHSHERCRVEVADSERLCIWLSAQLTRDACSFRHGDMQCPRPPLICRWLPCANTRALPQATLKLFDQLK